MRRSPECYSHDCYSPGSPNYDGENILPGSPPPRSPVDRYRSFDASSASGSAASSSARARSGQARVKQENDVVVVEAPPIRNINQSASANRSTTPAMQPQPQNWEVPERTRQSGNNQPGSSQNLQPQTTAEPTAVTSIQFSQPPPRNFMTSPQQGQPIPQQFGHNQQMPYNPSGMMMPQYNMQMAPVMPPNFAPQGFVNNVPQMFNGNNMIGHMNPPQQQHPYDAFGGHMQTLNMPSQNGSQPAPGTNASSQQNGASMPRNPLDVEHIRRQNETISFLSAQLQQCQQFIFNNGTSTPLSYMDPSNSANSANVANQNGAASGKSTGEKADKSSNPQEQPSSSNAEKEKEKEKARAKKSKKAEKKAAESRRSRSRSRGRSRSRSQGRRRDREDFNDNSGRRTPGGWNSEEREGRLARFEREGREGRSTGRQCRTPGR